MKTTAVSLSILLSLSITSAAFGQETPSHPERERSSPELDSAAYCEYVSGVAKAESVLLVAPVVFGTAGVVSGADATGGSSPLPPRGRVTAGVSYSASALVRGLAYDSLAAAECRRYRAESELHGFVAASLGGRSAGALAAKLAVLEAALPRAEANVKAAEAAVADAHGTVNKLHAVQMRVDAIRGAIYKLHEEHDGMSGAVAPPKQPLDRLLRNRDDAEQEVSRHEARVRSSKGWDLSVRGGYEQILGAPVTTPLFGVATLSVDLGWFFQGAAEQRAAEGRKVWTRRQVEGVDERAESAMQRLKSLRASEALRLTQTRALLVDVEARQKAVEAANGERATEFAEALWFDRLGLQAEDAYLAAHLKELDGMLGTGGAR